MKKSIHSMKVIKVVELILLILMEAGFLIIILSNHVMRSSIFVDKSLFILCVLMWSSLIVSFLILFYDFYKLKEFKILNHQLENLAYLDEKTGIPNRTSVDLMFEHYKLPETLLNLGAIVTEIANIRTINEIDGKEYGDEIIYDFSKIFERVSESYGFAGRNGGNDYITLIENCDFNKMTDYLDALHKAINEYNEKKHGSKIILNSEYVINDKGDYNNLSDMLSAAYNILRK